MAKLFGLFDDKAENEKITENSEIVEDGKLNLRQETLDISKNRVQTGEVKLRKEVVEEQKTMSVPVTHEEVVIERRAINNEPSDTPIGAEASIIIPVSAEHIEVNKNTVVTGEISAHKREVEQTEQVDETLRKEEARVDVDGDPHIVADDTINDLR